MSTNTIIGTTTFKGYICTSNGTATIEEPNPDTPKIKNAHKTINTASANESGSIKSKIINSQPRLFRLA